MNIHTSHLYSPYWFGDFEHSIWSWKFFVTLVIGENYPTIDSILLVLQCHCKYGCLSNNVTQWRILHEFFCIAVLSLRTEELNSCGRSYFDFHCSWSISVVNVHKPYLCSLDWFGDFDVRFEAGNVCHIGCQYQNFLVPSANFYSVLV